MKSRALPQDRPLRRASIVSSLVAMAVMSGSIKVFTSLLLVGSSSCGGQAGEVKHMREVANVDTRAAADGSVVVFIRPSGMGSQAQSSVFDVTDTGSPVLVGIIAAKKKVAYRTTPGRHMFMVVGENADFLDSNLAPGKVYVVTTMMGPGAFKPWFALRPVRGAERADLPGWLRETSWVETTDGSFRWAEDNASSIQAKRTKYFAEWLRRPPERRDAIAPEDGE